jgi:hypothetical protein
MAIRTKPYRKHDNLNVRVPILMRQKLERLARLSQPQVSVGAYVRYAISEHFRHIRQNGREVEPTMPPASEPGRAASEPGQPTPVAAPSNSAMTSSTAAA